MTSTSQEPDKLSWAKHGWLLTVTGLAVLAGLYGRFKGLGIWPFGVDEFYISRSIDHVLSTGLPQFPCGGYYTRGLLYQYTVALLRLGDLTPEFASRLVTAISSLLVLPAAYVLGRRFRSTTVGLLMIAMLSLSVWEIEMARFARMYAPFQAVFLWYLVFFVRYVVDRERRALIPMVVLSILGVMTWEGGALIGLLNFLPPFINHDRGKLRDRDWRYLAGMGMLFIALFASTTDLRGFADTPALPDTTDDTLPVDTVGAGEPLVLLILRHPAWLISMLIPFGFAVGSLKWLWSLRTRWLAASGLAAVVAAALLGQLLLCASIVILLLLSHLVSWRELLRRPALPFVLALATSAALWLAFGLLAGDLPSGLSAGGKAAALFKIKQVAGFPDVFDQIIRPWGGTLPILTMALFAALAALARRVILQEQDSPSALRTLLLLILVLGLAVGATKTPRYETRYTFFMYPVLLLLAVVAVASVIDAFRWTSSLKPHAVALVTLLLFALTEDFQPHHIATIDSVVTNFRIGLSDKISAHYYPRDDIRGVANWLREQARPKDLVLSGIPSLDQYYSKLDYVFLYDDDDRYIDYACNRGKLDRWTSRPLLNSMNALAPLVATGATIYIVVYPDFAPPIVDAMKVRGWTYRELSPVKYGGATVLILNLKASLPDGDQPAPVPAPAS